MDYKSHYKAAIALSNSDWGKTELAKAAVKMKNWSEDLRERTRKELEDMLTYVDSEDKLFWLIGTQELRRAHFKNIDGERFGTMSVENAKAQNFIIDLKSGGQEQFTTISALIETGWVLD